MLRLSHWISTFGIIFAVIDPFGYVPTFLAMTSKASQEKRQWMLKRACIAAFFVLALFSFVGQHILSFFGISIAALQISGGLILLVLGFDMLRVLPQHNKITEEEESEASQKQDISIVPLAIPMLSGPAAMASVIVLTSEAQSSIDYTIVITSIFVTLAFTYLILGSSQKIFAKIGVNGLHVVTRIMGLLLCAMAVQFVIDGYLAIKK